MSPISISLPVDHHKVLVKNIPNTSLKILSDASRGDITPLPYGTMILFYVRNVHTPIIRRQGSEEMG